MKIQGTFEADLIFAITHLHIGQKDGKDFAQISFPNLGILHTEVSSTSLTDTFADVTIPINDLPCYVKIEKNGDNFSGIINFESAHLENKQITVKKLSDNVEFATESYTIPQNNREILINSSDFEYKTSDVKFEYQLANSEVLEFIKSEGIEIPTDRSLDSALKLMDKVSKLYHHDGVNSVHDRQNRGTVAQIKFAKMHKGFTNCRGMAIILSGILRSCGYKATFVECRPVKSDVYDIHVVCEVFINELDKFVMLDPSQNLIFYRNGQPLSLIELRNALCEFKEDEITINPNANHNGEPTEKMSALAYMSKNLVYLQKCTKNGESLEINDGNSICLTSCDLLDDNFLNSDIFTSNVSAFYSKK